MDDQNNNNPQPQEPFVAPEPAPVQEQPTPAFQPMPDEPTLDPPVKKHSHKGLKIGLVVLAILALAGIGYSVYAWMNGNTLQQSATSKDAKISSLQSQISSLKATGGSTTTTPATVGNVVAFRELGVSLTVPDSIKDLTYSYISYANGSKAVGLSTDAIVDAYNKTASCTSYDGSASTGSPALGFLGRNSGTYDPSSTADTQLVKQFTGYYIYFSGPQSSCAANQGQDVTTALQALKSSFSTIKTL